MGHTDLFGLCGLLGGVEAEFSEASYPGLLAEVSQVEEFAGFG